MEGKGIFYITGPPGTGKTKYLYKKLEEIIKEKKAKPDEILFFVFNDKEILEIKEKIVCWTKEGFTELWINSFPSFCKKVLRENYYQLSTLPQKAFLSPNFQIIGGMEEKLVLKKVLESPSLKLQYYTKSKTSVSFINEVVNFIDLMKQNLHKLKSLKEQGGKFADLAKIFWKYNAKLRDNDYLDLRDVTLQTIDLFEGRDTVFKIYRNKFKYILVDDFEDIDYQQFRLFRILCEGKSNIFVSGNTQESIFQFRGARPEEIKDRFFQEFKPQVINLSNYDPPHSEVLPFKFDTSIQESFFIARKIYELVRGKNEKGKDSLQYKDFLILSRQIGEEIDNLVNALLFYQIPYTVVGGVGFMQPLIITLIAVLHIIDKFGKTNLSNFHIIRALTAPAFSIDRVDMERLVTLSERKNKSLLGIIKQVKFSPLPYLKSQTQNILSKFIKKIEEFQEIKEKRTLQFLLHKVYIDFGFLKQGISDRKVARQLTYFNEILRKYQRIENQFSGKDLDFNKFMDNLDKLLSSYGRELGIQLEEEEDEVKIMTVQQAKGKFFKVVFVIGLVEGRFPREFREDILLNNKEKQFLQLRPLMDSVKYMEEEKKIFQVAISRAKDMLYLTCAKKYKLGKEMEPSSLLVEFLKRKDKSFLKVEEKVLTYDDLTSFLLRNREFLKLEEYLKREKAKFSFYLLIKDKYSPSNLCNKVELPKGFCLTPSKIKAYLDCPSKFFFQYCLNIWSPPQPALLFGRLIHRVLEIFHNEYVTQEQMQGKEVLGKLNKILQEVWKEERNSFETNFERNVYQWEIFNILTRYLNLEKKRKSFLKVLKCERPLEWEIEGIKFKGRIDRIDMRKDSSWEIVDYKTTRSFIYQGDSLWKKWIEEQTDFQPVIYLLGARDFINSKICSFSIYWLRKDVGNDFKTTLEMLLTKEKMSISQDKKQIKYLTLSEMEEARNNLLSISKDILCGFFPPTQDYNTCGRCNFGWLCDGKVGSE